MAVGSNYTQLVQPILTIAGRQGWCLEYARKVFSAQVVERTAWLAWINAKYKHTGLPPTNVSVSIFFSGANGDGHVAVNVPNIGIYSSPWDKLVGHSVLSSISEVERIYGVKYVGWTEDISNVKIVEQGEEMTTISLNAFRQAYYTVLGFDGVFNPTNALSGALDSEWETRWKKEPYNEAFYGYLFNTEQGQLHRKWLDTNVKNALANPNQGSMKVVAEVDGKPTLYTNA
jgi:hypothetical protein